MQRVCSKSVCLLGVFLLFLGSVCYAGGKKETVKNTKTTATSIKAQQNPGDDWGFEVKALSAHTVGITWNPERLLPGTFEVQVLYKNLPDHWQSLADVNLGNRLSRLDENVTVIPTSDAPILLHKNLESSSLYQYRIMSASNKNTTSPVIALATPQEVPDGVYVGILSYAGTIEPITKDLIYLDYAGKQKIMNSLDSLHTLPDSGSVPYYAVHRALTHIDESQLASKLPDRISSKTLITFTDGLDTGSTNTVNLPTLKSDLPEGKWAAVREFTNPGLYAGANRGSIREYSRYIQERLRAPNIYAFSIGVQSQDTVNFAAFQETVQSLISPGGGSYLLDNYRQLEPQLEKILDSQLRVTSKPVFTFSVFTPIYPDDTKIRLTFDGKSPMASTKFIDARLVRRGSAGELAEMVGRNVLLATEGGGDTYPALTGRPAGKTEYRFTVTLNEEIDPLKVQQWYIQQTGGEQSWIRNSESERIVIDKYSFEYENEKQSNVVYLVLDASSSTAKDMDKIRNAAKFYVEKLYNELGNTPSPPALPVSANASGLFSPEERDASSEEPVAADPSDKPTVADFPDKPIAAESSAKPVDTADQTIAAESSVKPTATDSVPHSAFWVQLGAYKERANVNEASRIVQSKGYQARTIDSRNGNLRFVQAGPFETKVQADRAFQDLRRTPGWFNDCYVYSE